MRVIKAGAIALVFGLAALTARPAHAQFGHLKDKIKQKVQEHEDQATDKVVDSADVAAQCAAGTKKDCDQGGTAGTGGTTGSTAGGAGSAPAGGPVASGGGSTEQEPPGKGVWLNYDFVPGDKVLFYDDFANDRVGDLPTHEDVVDGNFTVVDLKGQKALRTVTGGTFWINLPEVLPQRFTIEATYFRKGGGNPLSLRIGDGADHPLELWCYQMSGGLEGEGANGGKRSDQDANGINENDFVHCRFMVDGGYGKAYINEQRLGQLNGLLISRTDKIRVQVPSADESDGGALITELRVAEGGKPLYDALAAAGRVSTHGILFATGSSTIEGESTPTLKEIGDMLTSHADLKLMIEGHTDNVGSAASNQTLSEARANAVRQYLIDNYHVDAGRLQAKGYGASKPVAKNDTQEGRQQNRRVELVKE